MTNIVLPTFPALASGAIFIKGVANNGSAGSAAQYVTFGHSFQIGQLPDGSGLAANFGSAAVPCQVDVKTRYPDGSAAHAVVTCLAPAIAAGAVTWAQFSEASPPSGTPLAFPGALGSNAVSITLTPTPRPDWTAGTAVKPGSLVSPTVGNVGGFVFRFVVPNWPGYTGVALGTTIGPTANNPAGYTFKCTTAGDGGQVEPVWPQTVGGTVTDGTVIWTNEGPFLTGSTEPTWPQTVNTTVGDNQGTWINIGTPLASLLSQNLVSLIGRTSTDLWLNGPLAIQGRAYAVLYDTLRVQVDMTAYADGTMIADVLVANDVMTAITSGNSAYGGEQDYVATITLNGETAFTSAFLIHYLYENWTWQVGTLPQPVNTSQDHTLQVVHDPNDFIAAQATQSYDTTLGVVSSNAGGSEPYLGAQQAVTATGFGQPLTNVSLVDEQMQGVGGRPDIGLNDAWNTWGFVTQNVYMQAVSLECSKINGYAPWHFWNEATGEFFTTDDQMALVTGYGPAAATPYTPEYGGLALPALSSTDPNWSIQTAHFPELVYLNYLQTGRRYFLDELNACATWVVTGTDNSYQFRNYGQGLIVRQIQIRASAWGLRDLIYATYANPDGSSSKVYFRKMLDNNLYWLLTQLEGYQQIQGDECFGWYPPWAYPAGLLPAWEEAFFYSSIAIAAIMGHPIASQISQWMANFFTGHWLNGANSPPTGFPPADAVVYDMQAFQQFVWTASFSPYVWGSQYLPFQNWAALESLQQEAGTSNINRSDEVVWFTGTGGGSGSYGYYGQLQWITLANLVTLGDPVAAECLNTLQTQTSVTGTNSPFIDDVSWAGGNQQTLTMVVQRTLNDSQIFPAAGAPAATMAYANPLVGGVVGAAAIATGVTPFDSMSGASMVGALEAKGGLSVTNANQNFVVDGKVVFGGVNARAISGSLTTSNAGDVIVLFVELNGGPVIAVDDTAGLTWTQRKQVVYSGPWQLDEWYAVAPEPLNADTITVTQTTSGQYIAACAVAISGADTTNPFDANSSVPATSGLGNLLSISTSNPDDFIIGGYRVSLTPGPTAGAGWTQDCGQYYLLVEHQLTSAAQSGLAFTIGTGSGNEQVGIGEAIVAANRTTTVALSGAGVIGPVVAAAELAVPTYAELVAYVSVAIAELKSVLGALGQWQAALTAQAASIEAVLAGLA